MLFTPKFLIVALILAGAVFVSFTVIRLGGLLIPHPTAPSSPAAGIETSSSSPAAQVPPNAFVERPTSSDQILGNQIEQPNTGAPTQAPVLSLPEIQKKIEAALPAPAPQSDLLALPAIPDSEIVIDPAGIRTPDEYLLYFATHIKDVPFDGQRFKSVASSPTTGALLPPQLVENALAGETSPALQDSLKTFRDLALAKAGYLKKVKVSVAVVAMHKRMIGFEELHAELLDKAIAVAAGAGSKEDLKTFYTKFKTTALQENGNFINTFGLVDTKKNFFADVVGRVETFLGLKKRASAQTPLLIGGVFALVASCPCPAPLSQVVSIIGTNPIILNVYYAWIVTPAFFPYKAMHQGAFWLGLYAPGTVPCLMWSYCGVSPCCVPNTIPPGPFGFLPIIAGTSQ